MGAVIKSTLKDTQKLSLKMRCGDCLHFKNGPKSPLYKGKCSDLGRQHYANACAGFTPDFTLLNNRSVGLDATAKIAKLVQHMNPGQKRVLGFMLSRQGSLFSKMGIHFGQAFYVYLSPTLGMTRNALNTIGKEDLHYLDGYYKAYAIGMASKGEGNYEVYLAAKPEGKPDYYVTVNLKEGGKFVQALTKAEFKVRADELIEAGKKRMPKTLRAKLSKLLAEMPAERKASEEYAVPTIDSVPYEWFITNSAAYAKSRDKDKKIKLSVKKENKFKSEPIDKLAARARFKKGITRISIFDDTRTKKKDKVVVKKKSKLKRRA